MNFKIVLRRRSWAPRAFSTD